MRPDERIRGVDVAAGICAAVAAFSICEFEYAVFVVPLVGLCGLLASVGWRRPPMA